MDDINKDLERNVTRARMDANEKALVDAFDGKIMFSIVSSKARGGEWIPQKPTICKMEVLAVEAKDSFTGAQLQTKSGKPFINLVIKAVDTGNSNNFRTVYEKLYGDGKERAYVVAKALGVNVPDFGNFDTALFLDAVGYAEITPGSFPGSDGVTRFKAIIKWLKDYDVSKLPTEPEELPF